MGTQACEVDEPVCWTIFKGYITVFKILQIFYPCFSHSITLSIQYWQKVQCWQRAPTYWCLRLSIFTWVSNLEILKIQGSNWLISDLIPKKYEKFEFSKNFVIIFLSSQNGPRKRNFNIFCPRIFDKLQKEIQNFTVGYLPLKMKILKNFFSHRNQRKILIRGTSCL